MRIFFHIINILFKSAKRGVKGILAFFTVGIDYISYVICVKIFGFSLIISNIFSWIITETISFLSNKFFKFKGNEECVVLKEYVKFFLARAFIIILESVLLKFSVDVLGINEFLVKFLLMIFVFIISFFIYKSIVFMNSEYMSLKDYFYLFKKKFKEFFIK